MGLGLLEEFRFDWELAGKAARTVDDYIALSGCPAESLDGSR